MHGADVAAVLEQMGRKGVAQGVTRRALRNTGAPDGVLDGALQHGLVQMVAAPLTGFPVDVDAGGVKNPLPWPFASGVRSPADRLDL